MRFTFLAISGLAAGIQGAQPAAADALPIGLETPPGCSLAEIRSGTWRCDFEAEDGHERSIILDYQEIVLNPEGRAQISSIGDWDLELLLQREVFVIDMERRESVPPGNYAIHSHDFLGEFLGDGPAPAGFISCSVQRDSMQLEGSDIRSDRASLHCWGASRSEGTLHQLLLSMIEDRAPSEPVAPSLGREFDEFVATVGAD